MIVLFTDFGAAGPYIGQVSAVLQTATPRTPVIDLCNNAPSHDPFASAYLLAALVGEFPAETVFLCVVDPGVGSARQPLVIRAKRQWFVGPDNGLFEIVIRRASEVRAWQITWRPDRLSASFHGRDLFAPIAAQLAIGAEPAGIEIAVETIRNRAWPDDLDRVIYIDHFGNAMTGWRAARVPPGAGIRAADARLTKAETFSDRATGEAFWYENANGLAEIAVNRGRADERLGLAIGDPIQIACP